MPGRIDRKQIVLLCALLLCPAVRAQYSDSTQHYISYSSTGTFNRTNESSSYLFNHGLKYGARKKRLSLNADNRWLYGMLDDELTNNDVSSVWDLDLRLHGSRFYYWSLLSYNRSYSLRVNHQLLAGGGIAYNVVESKTLLLNLSDGLLLDYSDISPADTAHEVYATPRNSFRLRIRYQPGNLLKLSATGFAQPSLKDFSDYILKADISLEVRIKKWLSFTAAYTFNRMTRTRTENMYLTYGVTLERYF